MKSKSSSQFFQLLKYKFKTTFDGGVKFFNVIDTNDVMFSITNIFVVVLLYSENKTYHVSHIINFFLIFFVLYLYKYMQFVLFPKTSKSFKDILNMINYKKSELAATNATITLIYIIKTFAVTMVIGTLFFNTLYSRTMFNNFLIALSLAISTMFFVIQIFKVILHSLSYLFYNIKYYSSVIVTTFLVSITIPFILNKQLYNTIYTFISKNNYLVYIPIFLFIIGLILSLFFNNYNDNNKKEIRNKLKYNAENSYSYIYSKFNLYFSKHDMEQKEVIVKVLVIPLYILLYVLLMLGNSKNVLTFENIVILSTSFLIIFPLLFSFTILFSDSPDGCEIFNDIEGYKNNILIFSRIKKTYFYLVLLGLILSIFSLKTFYLSFLIYLSLISFFAVIQYFLLRKSKIYGNEKFSLKLIFSIFANFLLSFIVPILLLVFNFSYNAKLTIGLSLSPFIIVFLILMYLVRYDKTYKNYMQTRKFDCGLASLRTILKYYSIDMTKVEYRKLINEYKNKEFSFQNLIEISKSYNLEIDAYNCNDLKKYKNDIKYPIIAQINKKNISHFIVIFEIYNNYAIIGNPSHIFTYTTKYDKLQKLLSGNILFYKGVNNDKN